MIEINFHNETRKNHLSMNFFPTKDHSMVQSVCQSLRLDFNYHIVYAVNTHFIYGAIWY
jgi:hypothetical protein